MYAPAHRRARLGLFLLIGAGVAACGSFDGASSRPWSVWSPYRMDVVQGNFVSHEQGTGLAARHGPPAVRDILGTPPVTSLFHADRWEYVFTLKRPGVEAQTRKLTVFFRGDAWSGTRAMKCPRSDFVAGLDTRKAKHSIPSLEATEAQLAKYPAPAADKGRARVRRTCAVTPTRIPRSLNAAALCRSAAPVDQGTP